jgi:hypothetical protein
MGVEPWSDDCEILANGLPDEVGEKLTLFIDKAGSLARAGNLTAAADALESARLILVRSNDFASHDNDIWVFVDIIRSIRYESPEKTVPSAFQRFLDATPPTGMDQNLSPVQKAFWYGSPTAKVGGRLTW